MQTLAAVLGLAAALVVAAVLVSSTSRPSNAASSDRALAGASDTAALYDRVPQNGMLLGRPEAPRQLVQAEDPQCPACAQYNAERWPEVVAREVRSGRASVRLQLWPFLGRDSVRGARFVAAAGLQDHAFDALELILRNQGSENSGYLTDAYLRRIGAGIPGLDVERALQDASTPRVIRAVQQSATWAQTNGATGTPTFWTRGATGLERHTTGDIDGALRALDG